MAAITTDEEFWTGHTKDEVEDYIKAKFESIDNTLDGLEALLQTI